MPRAMALQEELGGVRCLVLGTRRRLSHAFAQAAVRGGDTHGRPRLNKTPNTRAFTTRVLCCVPNRLLYSQGKGSGLPARLTRNYQKKRDFLPRIFQVIKMDSPQSSSKVRVREGFSSECYCSYFYSPFPQGNVVTARPRKKTALCQLFLNGGVKTV